MSFDKETVNVNVFHIFIAGDPPLAQILRSALIERNSQMKNTAIGTFCYHSKL